MRVVYSVVHDSNVLCLLFYVICVTCRKLIIRIVRHVMPTYARPTTRTRTVYSFSCLTHVPPASFLSAWLLLHRASSTGFHVTRKSTFVVEGGSTRCYARLAPNAASSTLAAPCSKERCSIAFVFFKLFAGLPYKATVRTVAIVTEPTDLV